MTTLKENIEEKFEFDWKKAYEQCEEISINRECTCDDPDSGGCVYNDDKYCPVKAMEWKNNQLKSELLPILLECVEALEKYKDGTAFEYNRHIRGEINFDSELSAATANQALERLRKWSEGEKT